MPMQFRLAPTAFLAVACLAPSLLTGCSGTSSSGTTGSSITVPALVAGNWQFSSSEAAAAKLPVISGELSVSTSVSTSARATRDALDASAAITGILHSQSSVACVAPSASFAVSGSVDDKGNVTLSGPLAGGTLAITGALSGDGKSLTNATYDVSGGTCAFAQPADLTAQSYAPISGTYAGNFTDSDGIVANVTANLTQSPDANGDGNYTLSGTAGLPNNPCFSSSTLTVSNTQVTGNTFTFSFTDPVTNASVTALGTFPYSATTLTVTSWTLTNCSTDTGTGTMTQQ